MNNLEIWKKNTKRYKELYKDKQKVVYETEINTKSILSLCPKDKKRVLELGCGLGHFTRKLINRYGSITITEGNQEILENAVFDIKKVKVLIFNLEKSFPKFNRKFDLIIAKLVLMYIKNLDNVAQQISRNLEKGGHFVLSVTHPLVWYKRSTHKKGGKNIINYFDEGSFKTKLDRTNPIVFNFYHRTFETYINTFAKYDLLIETVREPMLPISFIKKHSKYSNKKDIPLRLNLRFKKS